MVNGREDALRRVLMMATFPQVQQVESDESKGESSPARILKIAMGEYWKWQLIDEEDKDRVM